MVVITHVAVALYWTMIKSVGPGVRHVTIDRLRFYENDREVGIFLYFDDMIFRLSSDRFEIELSEEIIDINPIQW